MEVIYGEKYRIKKDETDSFCGGKKAVWGSCGYTISARLPGVRMCTGENGTNGPFGLPGLPEKPAFYWKNTLYEVRKRTGR